VSLLERTRRSVYCEDATTAPIIRAMTRAGIDLDVAIPCTAWLVRRMLVQWRAAGVA
jgi:sulfopyruvate decarboxylase TPP-binding subunit